MNSPYSTPNDDPEQELVSRNKINHDDQTISVLTASDDMLALESSTRTQERLAVSTQSKANDTTLFRHDNSSNELGVFEEENDPTTPEEGFMARFQSLPRENVLPLLLNLLAAFLFMMNSYVIEPSSAYYASALNSSDALAGIIMGAAPWFALVSSVVYSYWTNYNYKVPLLVCACLGLLGNILYAVAYTHQSMKCCLVGRALSGLGAPRIINRRYVADATPFKLRTVASAAFGMATALGAALGPAMAIVLNKFDFDFTIVGQRQYTFNGMTGPGYVMATCWLLYTVAIVFLFREPDRSGLTELIQREAKATQKAASSSYTTTALPIQEKGDPEDASTPYALFKEDTSETTSATPSRRNRCCNIRGGCLGSLTGPVVICMSLIFMKRIALESVVSSTSIVTKNRYGWTIHNVGLLHLVNGIIVVPVSALAGWLSTYYMDRYLAISFLVATLFGILFLIDLTDFWGPQDDGYNQDQWLSVGPIKYISGSLIAFSGIEACESFVASLMSKVVPSALATGTFNSGLLITLVGTGGRAAGDLFITFMGLISIRNLLNLLVLPAAGLTSLSIALIRWNYSALGV